MNQPKPKLRLNLGTNLYRTLRDLLAPIAAPLPPTPPTTTVAAGKRRTFRQRITPEVLQRIPAQISLVQRGAQRNKMAKTTVTKHLALFKGDAPAMFAAMSLTLRPSTVRTYCAALAAEKPHLKETIAPFKRHAQIQMLTAKGRPIGASPFEPKLLASAVQRCAVNAVRNAVITMFVTASRHVDLFHFHIAEATATFWKIELVPREQDGILIPPKNDQGATRHLIKWIVRSPAFDPTLRSWPSHADLTRWTKHFLGTTPHAIRRTATQTLQRQGFTGQQIATLTGHTSISEADGLPGLRAYEARLPTDPGATLCVHLSRLLLEQLCL